MNFEQLSQGSNASSIKEILSAHHAYAGFDTGKMSECTTVILLWDFSAALRVYQRMRGVHCAGGITNLRYVEEFSSALFGGIPNNAATIMLGIGYTMDGSGNEQERTRAVHEQHCTHATLRLNIMDRAFIRNTAEISATHPDTTPRFMLTANSMAKRDKKSCVIL